MQIKNIEALKTWLTARLEKICDADPAALAKYVVALVRKDKPLGELEEICIDQLEVFLGGETVSFVKTLFEVLQDNSYIPAPPKPTTPLPAEPSKQISPPKASNPPKQISPPKHSNLPKTSNPPKPSNPPKQANPPKQSSILPQQSNSQKQSNPLPKVSVSPQQPNPPLSPRPVSKRLLSTDESLRPQAAESSVLDEDDRDFKRTRKPVEEEEEKPISIINRDYHSSHKAKKRRAESDHDSGTRIKLSKDDAVEDTESEPKSKEEGDSRTKDDEKKKDEVSSKKKDDQQSVENERSEKKRENLSDRENSQRSFENSKGKYGRYDDRPSVKSRLYKGRPWNKRGRCRDYDEKGYCMRGELCPYDHGNDPLVVEDVNMPGIVLGFPRTTHPAAFLEAAALNPAGLAIRPPMRPIQYPVRPSAHVTANVRVPTSDLANAGGPHKTSDERRPAIAPTPIANVRPHIGMPRYKEVLPAMNDMYNPEQPSFDGRLPEKPPVWQRLGTLPVHHGNLAVQQRNRELLQVATAQATPSVSTPGTEETKNTVAVAPSANIASTTPQVVTSTAQEKSNVRTLTTTGPPRKYTNTVLEVKKLPQSLNNIATLNGYFQRFGKIVNIQVSALGQPDVALIQFATNFEAHKAISCADAVLGNRFIRIFWHKSEAEQQKSQTTPSENSQQTTIATSKKPTLVEKPVQAPIMFQTGQTTFKASVAAAVTAKKDANVKVVEEVVKKKILLQKQKQDLLCKQIENQKLLIKKLEESKSLHQGDKEKVIQTLKTVSESISKLQSEVKVSAALVRSKESPARARQVAQKELLDRELDLITHEQTGGDTTELRYRVEELKKEAQSLGLLDAGHRGRGRGRAGRGISRGISRGHARGRGVVSRSSAVLDKRPKQLLVEGFTAEEKDGVKQRFKEFGDVDRIEEDKDSLRLIITFGTRKQAENAITHVPSFNMKNLKVSWYRPTSTPPVSSPVMIKIPVGNSQKQPDAEKPMDQDAEELLLQGDVDEEDDEEERTWRR